MGATFAVSWAQAVSLSVVRRCGLGRFLLSPGTNIPGRGGEKIVVYIDDITIVGTNKRSVNQILKKIIACLRERNLPAEPRKTVYASKGPTDSFGLRWWPGGFLTPKPSLVEKVIVCIESVLQRQRVRPHVIRQLTRLWIWVCLLERCTLSVLDSLFTFGALEPARKSRHLPTAARAELNALLDLLPALSVDLSLPLSKRIYFTDASTTGAGVVYSDQPCRSIYDSTSSLCASKVSKGWYTRLLTTDSSGVSHFPLSYDISPSFDVALSHLQTKLAIKYHWNRPEHINSLELSAAVLAMRHMSRSRVSRGMSNCLFLDSTVAIGCLLKGRSSSRILNRSCRQAAGILIDADIHLCLHWVPSALNFADAPSRA